MLDARFYGRGLSYSRPVDLTHPVSSTMSDLAPTKSVSKGDVHRASSSKRVFGLGLPSTASKLVPPSSFSIVQRRTASDSDTSMVSSSHSRPSLDSSPSHLSSAESFSFPRTPTDGGSFSVLTPSSLDAPTTVPTSPTKQRRKFTISRRSTLQNASSTATLKPRESQMPTPTSPTTSQPKTIRRAGRVLKPKLDLASQQNQSPIPSPPSSPYPPVSFPAVFMTESSAQIPAENTPSSAVSVRSADVTLSIHSTPASRLPFPTSHHLSAGPKAPEQTAEARDPTAEPPLLQLKPRVRVVTPRRRVPSTFNDRSPFLPTAGFLLSTVGAGAGPRAEPSRPPRETAVHDQIHPPEFEALNYTGSSSESPEERARARSEWLRGLRNKTMSRLKSVSGLRELNELKKDVEKCERRSTERPEGTVRVRVNANNMNMLPPSRSSAQFDSDATVGRSHSRLGSASSASGMASPKPSATSSSTPSSSLHSSRPHSRTSIAFAELPHPPHHPHSLSSDSIGKTLGSWIRRPGSRPTSPTQPRRKASLIGTMFSRPGSMEVQHEMDESTATVDEDPIRKTEEMMRQAVWGKTSNDRRRSAPNTRFTNRHSQHHPRGSQTSLDQNASASASRSSFDVRSSRSTSPLPAMMEVRRSPVAFVPQQQQQPQPPPKRRPSRLLKKSFDMSVNPNAIPSSNLSLYPEPVSPRTPIASPLHASTGSRPEDDTRRSMGEFSDYVKTLPKNFAANYVAQLIEQREKMPTPSAAEKSGQKRKITSRNVSRRISAVFIGNR